MLVIEYVKNNQVNLSNKDIQKLLEDKQTNNNTLIKAHLALVYKISESYSKTTHINIDDLFSVGLEALQDAVIRFDTSKSSHFAGYAKKVILSQFNVNLYKDRIITVPKLYKGNTTAYTFSSLLLPDEEVSYVEKTSTNKADINYQFISDEEKLEQMIITTLNNSKWSYILLQSLGINQDNKRKQIDIAEELGVSKQCINQLIKKAIKKLKQSPEFIQEMKLIYDLI